MEGVGKAPVVGAVVDMDMDIMVAMAKVATGKGIDKSRLNQFITLEFPPVLE